MENGTTQSQVIGECLQTQLKTLLLARSSEMASSQGRSSVANSDSEEVDSRTWLREHPYEQMISLDGGRPEGKLGSDSSDIDRQTLDTRLHGINKYLSRIIAQNNASICRPDAVSSERLNVVNMMLQHVVSLSYLSDQLASVTTKHEPTNPSRIQSQPNAANSYADDGKDLVRPTSSALPETTSVAEAKLTSIATYNLTGANPGAASYRRKFGDCTVMAASEAGRRMIPIAPVEMFAPDLACSFSAAALLDSGADSAFVSKSSVSRSNCSVQKWEKNLKVQVRTAGTHELNALGFSQTIVGFEQCSIQIRTHAIVLEDDDMPFGVDLVLSYKELLGAGLFFVHPLMTYLRLKPVDDEAVCDWRSHGDRAVIHQHISSS